MDQIESSIAKFFLIHTKAELEEEALIRDMMLYPVNTISDLLENPQLRARKFWVEVEHPELNSYITYPGGWVKCSDDDFKIKRAPLIGEHNVEIYKKELGLSEAQLLALREAGII
jgi:crotonobetainyl-CoA:carnitine CoA-transferase CaiB-like acyl-CoA transferase